ncbi:hypothetical protein TrST_g10811 [Triparma strigata]|uniref:Uncharacterized protein n=1 Tax=Triparma strigata TaxID=1606541 RepID=A0A9W7F312_9STRA|nr:hypothetical protein TrST_g10811 [Triparma strigata]
MWALKRQPKGTVTYKESTGKKYQKRADVKKVDVQHDVKVIGDGAFSGCNNLDDVDWTTANITQISEKAFYETAISALRAPASLTTVESSSFFKCKFLVHLEISSVSVIKNFSFSQTPLKAVILNATEIGNGCFVECTSLKAVNLGQRLKKLGSKTFKCTAIEEVELPDTLEAMGEGCFSECAGLASVSWKCEKLQIVPQNCFSGSALTSFSAQSVTEIGADAFRESITLETIEIPSVQVLRERCFSSTGLKEVTLTATLKVVETESFSNCFKLSSIKFSNCTLPSLSNFLFRNANVQTVTLPSCVGEVGEGCFMHCDKLTKFVSTGARTLGPYCFNGCTKLKVVKVNSVAALGSRCFQNCKKLDEITFGATDTDIRLGEEAFSSCHILLSRFENSLGATVDNIVSYFRNNPLMIMLQMVSPMLENLKKLHDSDEGFIKGNVDSGLECFQTPLSVYCKSGLKAGVLKWLLDVHFKSINVLDIAQQTPLHILFSRRHSNEDSAYFVEMLKSLISTVASKLKGASLLKLLAVKNTTGETCLHTLASNDFKPAEAVWAKTVKAIDLAFASASSSNPLILKNTDELTPLHVLCQKSNLDIDAIKCFTASPNAAAYLSEVDEFGYTPLHTIIQRHRDVSPLTLAPFLVLSSRDFLDSKCLDGLTCAELAKKNGCMQCVCDLLGGVLEKEEIEGCKGERMIEEAVRVKKLRKVKKKK